MTQSVWSANTKLPSFSSLKGNIKTDVLIIGGGICGLLCAQFLKDEGVNYILVEGSTIVSGTTKNTTAKITSQHSLVYAKLIKDYGTEKAKMYLDANQLALQKYSEMCDTIDCDFEIKDAYTYSLSDKAKIEKEVSAVNKLGLKAEFAEKIELPFSTQGAIRFKDQAQFNPLKFVSSIAKNLNILENTLVREITLHSITTDFGSITADKIIVATHFPFINKHGSYFLKLYQHRSYVAAFENAQQLNGMYLDENDKGMSFRNYQNLMFIGGEAHRTGKSSNAWRGLKDFAKTNYPKSKVVYEWAAQDCMSLDSVPYIGQYSASTPNLYVATGFNKWGITSSMASASILTDMIMGRKNDFAEVFSPSRSIIKPQLLVNGIEAVLNLVTPTTKRCPHLGCALKWNKSEHTWDCPCHGSRFDKDGKLIDNPATGDAKIK